MRRSRMTSTSLDVPRCVAHGIVALQLRERADRLFAPSELV